MKHLARFSILTVSALFATALQAHDFWIEPDAFSGPEGKDTQIILREGVDMQGDTLPFIPQWFDDFSLHTPFGDDNIASMVGNDPAARIKLRAGTNLIGYQSTPKFVALEAEKFKQYLVDEGMDYIIERRQELGQQDEVAKEYFVRCAKSLLYGDADASDDIFSRQLGYTLELVPQNDRESLNKTQKLIIRLQFKGEPLAQHRIRAIPKSTPDTPIDVITDDNGLAELPLADTDTWLIKSVHMVEWQDDAKADWISYWASLTIETG
ncbi:MAG: DUF4198 domain-containing protein [Gammaproteobacteria bacterium]